MRAGAARGSVDGESRVAGRAGIEERSSPGEPVGDPVPVGDSSLAVLPAEEDDLRIEKRREIDQSGFRAVHDAAVAVDLPDEIVDLGHERGSDTALLEVPG